MRAAARWMMPALAAVVLASAPAHAQSQEENAEFRRNCSADYSRLCSAYDPGSPQVRQCFTQRRSQLSERCAATIAKYQGGRR